MRPGTLQETGMKGNAVVTALKSGENFNEKPVQTLPPPCLELEGSSEICSFSTETISNPRKRHHTGSKGKKQGTMWTGLKNIKREELRVRLKNKGISENVNVKRKKRYPLP